jgi:YHS domain-containing protein
MKLKFTYLVMFSVILVVGGSILSADEHGDKDKPALKCPVSGKVVNPEVSTAYHGGTVYLCCPGCAKPLAENPEKYAAKANLQLVRSGQAEQVGCPLSGRSVNPDVSSTVAGVSVGFCCGGCKGKVDKAGADEQLELVFHKGFDKAYKVAAKEGGEK